MALIKGVLASFADPLLGGIPTLVLFQYNPTEVTRVFRVEAGEKGEAAGDALNAVRPAPEDYTAEARVRRHRRARARRAAHGGLRRLAAARRARDADAAGRLVAPRRTSPARSSAEARAPGRPCRRHGCP